MTEVEFSEVYERYAAYVVAGCLMRLGDEHRAKDAAQEVWIAFWKDYDPQVGQPRPFLTTLITIKSSDIWRQDYRKPTVTESQMNVYQLKVSGVPEDSLFETIVSERSNHAHEREPEAVMEYADFLKETQEVLNFVRDRGRVSTDAVYTLLDAGRRLSSIGGGEVGDEGPAPMSSAQRSALRHLRIKLRQAFSYWADPWGATCDVSTIRRIEAT
jgi:DNA-directed RNA polymerase specialized sigma24 family protein